MQHQSDNNQKSKTIYYDGGCPMCTVVMDKIDDSPERDNFDSKDLTRDSLPNGITKEQIEKEIHVIDSDGKVYRNAEAILKIIEEYPRSKLLVKIGRLPIIRQLLLIAYRLIAVNRHFLFGSASRIFWLKTVIVSGLMAGLLLSPKLWSGRRFFPMSPVFDNFLIIPSFVEAIFYVLLLGLLTTLLFYPKPQKLILTTLVIMGGYALFDQMRWQPWFYQYFFMLATLGLFSWDSADDRLRKAVLNTNRLIIASIYFFSGLQKVNLTFMVEVFPWMMSPVVDIFPSSLQSLSLSLSVFVPFLEMGIGIGLLTKRYRKYAITLVLLMLGFVLFTLGPLGHNWNSVVWPWNIVMALSVVILFWRVDAFSLRDVLWTKKFPFQRLVLILFVIMPVFSFFSLWDAYLSSSLYSGNTNTAQLYVNDSVKKKLPAEVMKHITHVDLNKNRLDFFSWSFNELNVPPYPETRVYIDIAEDICTYAEDKRGVTLVVNGKASLLNRRHQSTYNCLNM